MTVWAYTIVRNEIQMLPWWIRHYQSFCEKLIVYDDRSDDGTDVYAREAGCDVRALPYSGLDDGLQAQFSSWMYREARGQADFVVVVDADEFLVGPIRASYCLPYVGGFQMVSDDLPSREDHPGQLYDYCQTGIPYPEESKPCVFRPELNLEFGVGRHGTNIPPTETSNLKLLHYRWFGRSYAQERNARNFARLSERAQRYRWGFHTSPEHTDSWANDLEARFRLAKKVI